MKIGVKLPGEEFADDVAAIRDFAQAAEGVGFSHLLAYDHVLGAQHADRTPPLPVPYNETTYFHEPFVLLGHLAAFTSTIELATGVVILPQRQTALVAKQAAEVSILSNGRLRLGVGVGWNYVEYEALAVDFSTRGARQEEQIELLRRFWTEPVVDFHGRFHDVDRAGVLPRPHATIPIWVGGFSDAAYRRAARVGDGFISSLRSTTGPQNDLQGIVERVRALVAEAGRDPSAFGFDAVVPAALEPGALAEQLGTWRDAGLSHLTLYVHRAGDAPADTIARLSEYADTIG
jgi:probable F420-dependent oxidoreductase